MMWGWDNWWIGGLMMFAFWALVIGLIVWGVRGFGSPEHRRTERDPKDILAERFARGEISEEEFDERRDVLEKKAS